MMRVVTWQLELLVMELLDPLKKAQKTCWKTKMEQLVGYMIEI